MRGNIASPKEYIRFKFINFFAHFVQHRWWDITPAHGSVRSSSICGIFRKAAFDATAENIAAFGIVSLSVVKIDMNIGELDKAKRFALYPIKFLGGNILV